MEVSIFFKELVRMCKFKQCGDCPICCKNGVCSFLKGENIEEVIELVEQWSKEHPQKTRLDDFKEKYPNANLDEHGVPECCCAKLGYCISCDSKLYDCKRCWNLPLEDK